MKCKITMYPNEVAIIKLYGELDHHEVERVRSQISTTILQGNLKTLIWNLEYLQFMDSSGVGLVLGRMRELHAVNGRTIILNPSPTMEKIFRFSGLAAYMMHGAEEAAISQARGIVNG